MCPEGPWQKALQEAVVPSSLLCKLSAKIISLNMLCFRIFYPCRGTQLQSTEVNCELWKKKGRADKISAFLTLEGKAGILEIWKALWWECSCFVSAKILFSEVTVNAQGTKCNIPFTCQLYFIVCHCFQYRTTALLPFLYYTHFLNW